MTDNTNTQTADGWTHLNNLEILNNSVIQGNLTVLGTINGSEDNAFTITAISTAGAGTLTAAGLIGGMILRTGPVAAFSDATATAAAIYSALGSPAVNTTVRTLIKNATAFTQTITAGSGVTLPTTVIVPAFSVAEYVITINSATAVTLAHVVTNPIAMGTALTVPAIGALSTVGAGTITAALMGGGIVNRAGAQSATPFTDTTDTAANIIASNAALVGKVGSAVPITYVNATNATATITGGVGVTVSGITAIPAGMAVRYLVTYTAAATLTMVGVSVEQASTSQQEVVLAGSTSGTATIVANATAGATTSTLPAVTGTLASTTSSNLFVTDVYRSSASVTANATVTPATITGLAAPIAIGSYRFRAVLPSTVASGTGGIAYNFLLTTAVLSSIQYGATMTTAAALQYTQGTTATSGTVIATQAAVVLNTVIEGTFVVGTAGTFTLQMAQNTSNASNSVTLIGSSLELCRIA